MNWKFWKKEEDKQETCFSQLSAQLTVMSENMAKNTPHMSDYLEHLTELSAQVQKVARIQYKTGQDMSGKLEQLKVNLDTVQQQQNIQQTAAVRIQELEYLVTETANSLIKWLDDIDMLTDRLAGQEQGNWQALLQQWSVQIILALQKIGVWEIDLLGHTFMPQYAEAIGTVTQNNLNRQENMHNLHSITNNLPQEPYAVVKIIKRGYVFAGGQLLRKAQVITLQEEKYHDS